MSQFGMQMPGGKARGGASPDVYSGLLFASVIALAAACAVMWMYGSRVGKDGSPIGLQDQARIQIPQQQSR
ncbi:MAG: hypothetical protein RBS39_08485 [Phycisphaerales bacterium]|jgi:hypothetical protein|nr:hypothetical protein [Phycisphaerales bacterium]